MKKNWIAAMVFAFLLIASPGLCRGCSCAYEKDPLKALDMAGVVFAGQVLDIRQNVHEDRKKGEIYDHRYVVRFQVQQSWKGTDQTEFVVMTSAGGDTACGFDFQLGESYLVYAYQTNNANAVEWHTSTCSRTKLLAAASDDLAKLPSGHTPTQQTDLSDQMKAYQTSYQMFQARMIYYGYIRPFRLYIAAAFIMALLGGLFMIFRRRKKS
ncbi:hypothetical protein DVH26_28720 [Paenibacillus sp. H1-7]|uniref:hypothetical protein n=1 Tax=Paenibacillus sp. H1-7 TaxID=2282849 RepID=UPI001EF7A4C1|nr:hypothetical protein [Paenibacillus sp. H1-7]ULL18097.1 hypothetical protein DVH26_28720 [Paenibacillus sp. H1-7]